MKNIPNVRKMKKTYIVFIKINAANYQPVHLGESLENILGNSVRVIVYQHLENEEK